jgi:hypothetical protein
MYPALLPLMRTPRLSAVDRTDAPADLNGHVHFGERRNMVYAHVSSRFKRSLYSSHSRAPIHPSWFFQAISSTLKMGTESGPETLENLHGLPKKSLFINVFVLLTDKMRLEGNTTVRK